MPISPFHRMESAYRESDADMTFAQFVDVHLRRGFVFSTPEIFLMLLPIRRNEVENWGHHPLDTPLLSPDCWYVSALCGDLSRAYQFRPYSLPWVAFVRRKGRGKRLSFHPSSRLEALTSHPNGRIPQISI